MTWYALLALYDVSKHFVLSACAGFVAWWLTWIMCSFCYGKGYRSLGKTCLKTPADHSTYRFSWSVAVFASFLAHCWLDGLLR